LEHVRVSVWLYRYSFFTSVIPALTFGEYIFDATEGQYGGSQILSGAAIGGVIQVRAMGALPSMYPAPASVLLP
jgi:hypothetical protein